MAAGYSRQSFEAVRQQERARLRELEALGAEFGRDDAWVRSAWEGGEDPAAVRERLASVAARQRDRDNAIRPHPDGAASGPLYVPAHRADPVVARPPVAAVDVALSRHRARPHVARQPSTPRTLSLSLP